MRPTQAWIDLGALQHNYQLARQHHGQHVLAVIKANAYGHGAVACARALGEQVDGFAVATVEEAIELRDANILTPLLVLEGAFSGEEIFLAQRHQLQLVFHHDEQLHLLEKALLPAPIMAWIKINSGMNRIGFNAQASIVRAAWQRLRNTRKCHKIVLMTHLARADELDSVATAQQLQSFESATTGLPGPRSISNSAGILHWPSSHRDWGRAGILLYGVDPANELSSTALRPVMTLTSRVFAERSLVAGEYLGYGGRFQAERPCRVGLVAIGYADGYPRCVANGTPVMIDGQTSRLIGRVSMDMLSVDLTELPQCGIGSAVQLWGKQLPVGIIARAANTIAYELLCKVKRVPLVYGDHVEEDEPPASQPAS